LPLMETSEEFGVNQTRAEVAKSCDIPLWEGFTILLVNAARDYHKTSGMPENIWPLIAPILILIFITLDAIINM